MEKGMKLPDSGEWVDRQEYYSETSSRIYVVARRNGTNEHGCSCPGWRTHRKCKHLTKLGYVSYQGENSTLTTGQKKTAKPFTTHRNTEPHPTQPNRPTVYTGPILPTKQAVPTVPTKRRAISFEDV